MGRSTVVVIGAILFGLLAALSLRRYEVAAAQVDLPELKRRFVTEARIERAHNDVAQQVGIKAWKNEVKPRFLREVTRRAAIDAGTPFPSEDEIIDWVKNHPTDTRVILEEAGAESSRAGDRR